MKKILIFSALLGLALVFVLWMDYTVHINGSSFFCKEQDSFPKQAVLVLGARVWNNGDLSDIFKDRVKTAIGLYKQGKVKKILVSGDHGQSEYDEVSAAKDFILQQGVPGYDVFLDHAGFDTYDSVYRAKAVFQAESLIIVTQNFHLPRALYIAKDLGIEACGVSADLQEYVDIARLEFRERLARVKAFLDLSLGVEPKYLGEAIPLTGDGRESWD